MARFKINIPDAGSLCMTCREGKVVDRANGKRIVWCQDTHPAQLVPGDVSSCTSYDDKRLTSKWDMEKIAWEIKHDNSGRIKGFTPPKRPVDD